MRISYGKDRINEYVREVYLGDVPVEEIWLGDEMLYPDEEGVVAAIEVALPDDAETLTKWHAALAYVESGASWEKYIRLVAGDTESRVGQTHNGFPLSTCVGAAKNRFEFDLHSAPSFSSLQVGDDVLVDVNLTQAWLSAFAQPGENKEGTHTYDVPFIPGTWVRIKFYKGRKKQKYAAGAEVTLIGFPSETQHLYANVEENCYGRPPSCVYDCPAQNNILVEGDKGFRVWAKGRLYAGNLTVTPFVPSLKFKMKCRVTAVYLRDSL